MRTRGGRRVIKCNQETRDELALPGGLGRASQLSSCHPQGTQGSASGVVRRCAKAGWLGIPCGFLPGQTRLHSLVDRHLRGPSGALTLAHCSSSCRQLSDSPSRLLAPATPEQVLGLITATPVGIADQGAQKAPSSLGDIFSSRNQNSILWKVI